MAKVGRPKTEVPKCNRVTVRFDDAEYIKLKKYADKDGLTITEFIRKGVETYLDSLK